MNVRHAAMLIAAVASAACSKAAPPPAANVITIHTADYAFTAPDTIPAGLTTIVLTNAGPSPHHVQLIRIDSGKTFSDLMAAFRNPGPPPRWAVMVAGPNAPQPPTDSSSTTSLLDAGHYALICFIPDTAMVPHFAHGMARPLEVVASSAPLAAEPAADVEITLNDFSFTESAPITAATRVIKIVNAGPQPHEMFIARLDSGTTAAALAHWVEGSLRGNPPGPMRMMGGISGLMPGAHTFINVHLAPGTYGLFCFFPDMTDGKEHTRHGMLKEIRVS